MIGGATRLAAVIGHPVGHSLSPALHNAAFAELGLDWVYVALDVAPGAAGAALAAMRTLGIAGLSVTMPHKGDVARLVDRLDVAAAALDSVNTVSVGTDGELVGWSTDGDGFVAALAEQGHAVAGRHCGVIGGGGAARSIVEALARAGAARIDVVNRTASNAEAAAALGGDVGRVGREVDLAEVEVLVNATSVGMGTEELPCETRLIGPQMVVADIVYRPRRTAWLDAAERRGAAVVDGLGMLVHQAALQQHIWHGRRPSTATMASAAELQLVREAH